MAALARTKMPSATAVSRPGLMRRILPRNHSPWCCAFAAVSLDGMRKALAVLALVLLWPAATELQTRSMRQVKVVLEFRQSAAQSRDAVQGSGRIIITDRGGTRASGGITGESTSRTVTRSTWIFTIVQDGGESTLLVASQVPYVEVTYYRDYLARTGHLAAGVAFKEVGTALKVRASVLPENQVRVRLTPTI